MKRKILPLELLTRVSLKNMSQSFLIILKAEPKTQAVIWFYTSRGSFKLGSITLNEWMNQ